MAAGGGQIVTAPVSLPVRAAAHMSVESLADEVALQPPGGRLHVLWRQPLMWAGMIALACLVAGWVALALARQPRQTYGLIVLDDGIDEET